MHHTQAHVLAVLGRVQQGTRLRGTHAPGRGGQVARGASRIATVRLLQDILRRVADAQCSEISFLLGVKSKYIPGGEFEPDWKGPVGAPGMPPTGPPPDAGPPPPPPEVHAARPAWRTVSTRTSKKKKKDQMPAAPPVAQPDPRQQVRSWATWQRELFVLSELTLGANDALAADPNLAPSPSSFDNPTLAAPAESPGLFGPRSPRSSRHLG